MMETDFGTFLLAKALVTPEHLDHARWVQDRTQEPDLLRILQDLGFIDRYGALMARAGYHGISFVRLPQYGIEAEATYCLPSNIAMRHLVLPVRQEGDTLVVATARPEDALADVAVRLACGRPVRWVVAPLDDILYGIIRHYRELPTGPGPAF